MSERRTNPGHQVRLEQVAGQLAAQLRDEQDRAWRDTFAPPLDITIAAEGFTEFARQADHYANTMRDMTVKLTRSYHRLRDFDLEWARLMHRLEMDKSARRLAWTFGSLFFLYWLIVGVVWVFEWA